MLPGQRAAALQTAKDVAAGNKLTLEEWNFAKGHQDLFGDALKRMGSQMAGPEYDQIVKLMHLDERGKKAEREVIGLDTKIKIDVTGLETNLGAQIMQKLMPQISAFVANAEQKAATAIEKEKQATVANRSALY
jgi:hypothetical protein